MRNTLIILLLAFAGCQTLTNTNDLPYEDLIVVKGMVQSGQPVQNIYFTHTLPLNVTYSASQAILTDVSGHITVDGKQYPLQYADSGLYSCPSLIGESGKTYILDADWNGKHVHSETTIPQPVQIDSLLVTDVQIDSGKSPDPSRKFYTIAGNLLVLIEAKPGGAYALTYSAQSGITGDTTWFIGGPGIVVNDPTPNAVSLWLSYNGVSNSGDSLSYINKPLKAIVYSYDPHYYDFITSYNPNQSFDIFSSGGINPNWNVTGDGFGIFIGVSVSEKAFEF